MIPQHLLVTGGAGFIGSHFTRYVLRVKGAVTGDPSRVTVLDSLTYAGDEERLRDVAGDPRFRFVHGDICDHARVSALLAGGDGAPPVDAIAHFAAETHVDRSIVNPAPFIRANIQGTYALLEAVRARPNSPVFLHVSTDEVYGDLGPNDAPFTEESPLAPSSPYSASKAAADGLVLAWRRTYGVRAVITRGANNYGTHQFPEKLIPVAMARAIAGLAIPLYGDGSHRREWLHVDDHSEALWTVLTAPVLKHAVYNIPGEADVSNLAVAEMILDSLGLSRSKIEFVADRKGHDRRYALDGTRIREEFSWVPKRRLKEAMAEIVAFEKRRRGNGSGDA